MECMHVQCRYLPQKLKDRCGEAHAVVVGEHDSAKQVADVGVGLVLAQAVRQPAHPQAVAQGIHFKGCTCHVIENLLHVAQRRGGIDARVLALHGDDGGCQQ